MRWIGKLVGTYPGKKDEVFVARVLRDHDLKPTLLLHAVATNPTISLCGMF